MRTRRNNVPFIDPGLDSVEFEMVLQQVAAMDHIQLLRLQCRLEPLLAECVEIVDDDATGDPKRDTVPPPGVIVITHET